MESPLNLIRRAKRAILPRSRIAAIRKAIGMPIVKLELEWGPLYVDLRDSGVGLPIYVDKLWEIPETRFLCNCLKEGATFIDVGANVGYFTMLASSCVGATGVVMAIEPDPHNFSLLSRAARSHKNVNVRLANIACGDAEGTLPLYKSTCNFGDHRFAIADFEGSREAVSVRVSTLDVILDQNQIGHPDVVKMDVQGFELHALRGFERRLANDRPLTILMEYCPTLLARSGQVPGDCLTFLEHHGLTAHRLECDGTTTPLRYDEIQAAIPYWESVTGPFINLVLRR